MTILKVFIGGAILIELLYLSSYISNHSKGVVAIEACGQKQGGCSPEELRKGIEVPLPLPLKKP